MFTVLAVKILLIFFPGILGAKIMETFLQGKKKYTNTEWVVNSFLLGLSSYVIVTFSPQFNLNFIDIFSDVNKLKITTPIFISTVVVSVILSSFLSLALNKDIIHIAARWLGITIDSPHKKVIKDIFSSETSYLKDLRGRYVNVKRYDINIHYVGFIKGFDLEGNLLELLLDDVTVYYYETTDDGTNEEKSYDIKSVYLNLNTEKISIEFN